MVKHAALLLAIAACNDNNVALRIIIDSPAAGSLAAAFPDLDTVELQVATAGEPVPRVTRTFQRGQDIELPDVPYGENLVVHMIGRVGPNELAVGRTCPFSLQAGEEPPSPHLYFARTVLWAEFSQPKSSIRDGATALTDSSGNALFIGGVDGTALPVSGIDRFDALNGVFEEVANVEPRRNGAAAQLGDGRIVIVGGTGNSGVAIDTIETVNLSVESDRRVESSFASTSLITLSAPAMTSTSDGHVVAFGGACGTCSGAESSKPLGSIVDIRDRGGGTEQRVLSRASLAIPRKQHTATRTSDDIGAPIIVIGGLDVTGKPIARAELYKPLLEEMVPGFAPMMLTPRRDHKSVRLPDGSVLVVGGIDEAGNDVRQLEIFNFDSGFQSAGFLPEGAGVTDFTVTPLPDGGILFVGGKVANSQTPVDTAFIIRLDSTDGDVDVVTTGRLGTARARHQATLLCDGTVMLVGGTLLPAAAERYNPTSTGRR